MRVLLLSLLLVSCAPAQDEGMLERAVETYTRAIEDGRAGADIYNRRGSAYFMLGRITESIDDFDRAIALSPSSDPYHWQRGISYYYAGRFREGREQFERHQTVNPNDVENGVWHFLCAARELGVDEARKRMLPISGDPRIPMSEVYELFRGRLTVDDVFAAAHEGDPSEDDLRFRLFYAHLYVGLYYEALEDEARMREHIRKAAEDYSIGHYMWHVARVHAARME